MQEGKVNKEQAEKEFNDFIEVMDLDCDTDTMDENDKSGFFDQKRIVIRSVMKGDLVFDDDSQPVFTPAHKASSEVGAITFHEPEGSNYMEMDRKKLGHDIAKMHAVMAGMTKKPAKLFASLKGRDHKICVALVTLFLG